VKLLGSFVTAIALLTTGCIIDARKAPPPAPVTQPTPGDPMLTADGLHFAASRTYQGECAPAGSRGGCYSITLEPDGAYRQMLLDAAITGTYVITGSMVKFTPSGAAPPSELALSADRTKLGDYVYQLPTPEQGPTVN
jgi:hypothetical protein